MLLEDAAEYLELSKQMARKHLKSLEDKGLVEAISLRPLKFQLTDEGQAWMGLV